MSFVDKVKGWFNIGFDVQFKMDRNFQKHTGELKGQLVLSSTIERKIKNINIFLEQHCKKTRLNGNESIDIVTIGKTVVNVNDVLKPNESKTVDFTVNFAAKENFGDKVANAVADQGGMLGVIGSIGATARNMQVDYSLKVKSEIEGALFKSEEILSVKLL